MPDVFSTVQDVDNHVVLDYTSRDFTAIRAQLIGLAHGLMPEWESIGEPADFGTLLLELFAYMGDVMHFYIDRTASEAFLGTALRRQSVLYIADMLGYTPIGQQSAIVGLDFTLDPASLVPITIPAGTRIHNNAGSAEELIVFELELDVVLNPGDGFTSKPPVRGYATEGIMHYDSLLGISLGTPNTEFIIPDKGVVYGSISMKSREGPSIVTWTYISHLSLARPTQSVFTTFIDEAEFTHVVFGDSALGRVPPVNAEIFVTYRTGVGAEANSLSPAELVVIKPQTGVTVDLWSVSVTNPASPVGGTDPESIDAMRQSIPRAAVRLKSRAITLNDYADLALQVPGVAKSMAHGTVYTSVHVRIAPIQGQADDKLMDELCDRVERYLEDKIIVGSVAIIEPRPISTVPGVEDAIPQLWQDVYIYVMVHVQDSYNRTTVRIAVEKALRQMLAFDAVNFGTRVSIGSIYRTALSIQGVEWVDLIWLHDEKPDEEFKIEIWSDDDNRQISDIVTPEKLIPNIVPPMVLKRALISTKALTSNVALLTTSTPHGLVAGDIVTVTKVDDTFNGRYDTITVPSPTQISYARTAANVASVAVTTGGEINQNDPWRPENEQDFNDPMIFVANVSNKALTAEVATLTTATPHGLVVGDSITVVGVDDTFDGRYDDITVPTTTTISFAKLGEANVTSVADTGVVNQNDLEYPFPDMDEEERTHDGLWVRAVGGLPST